MNGHFGYSCLQGKCSYLPLVVKDEFEASFLRNTIAPHVTLDLIPFLLPLVILFTSYFGLWLKARTLDPPAFKKY